MKIELISEADYNLILKISVENPNLIFQRTDYEYVDKSKFTLYDKVAFGIISEILKKHITGFSEFNNLRYSKEDKLQLRFQYNYGAADNTMPFTGVGYLLVEELLKGFNPELHLKK